VDNVNQWNSDLRLSIGSSEQPNLLIC